MLLTNNVRLKSAKNLYLSHRFFCKIRQIHRFFCIFRQKLQILCRNQAREKLGHVTQETRACHAEFMSLKCTPSLSKSTQIRREKQANRSDMARKSGKSLRLDALFRLQRTRLKLDALFGLQLKRSDLMHILSCCKSALAPCDFRAHGFLTWQRKKRPDRSLTSPVSFVGWTYLRVTVAPASSS